LDHCFCALSEKVFPQPVQIGWIPVNTGQFTMSVIGGDEREPVDVIIFLNLEPDSFGPQEDGCVLQVTGPGKVGDFVERPEGDHDDLRSFELVDAGGKRLAKVLAVLARRGKIDKQKRFIRLELRLGKVHSVFQCDQEGRDGSGIRRGLLCKDPAGP